MRINNVGEPFGSNGLRINEGIGNMNVQRKDSFKMVNKMKVLHRKKMDSIKNKYNN